MQVLETYNSPENGLFAIFSVVNVFLNIITLPSPFMGTMTEGNERMLQKIIHFLLVCVVFSLFINEVGNVKGEDKVVPRSQQTIAEELLN